MLWVVVLLYVAGGGLAAAVAVVVVYRIAWMKSWEAGAAAEIELFDSLL